MTALILYYSRTEKTKYVAETIAENKNADIIEIKDTKNRKGIFGYIKGGYDAVKNNLTKIEPETIDLTNYNTIYIGSPVWNSKPAPAIITLIHDNDFKDKNVITFSTMHVEAKKAIKLMNQLITFKGATVSKSFAVKSGSEEEMKEITLKSLNI